MFHHVYTRWCWQLQHKIIQYVKLSVAFVRGQPNSQRKMRDFTGCFWKYAQFHGKFTEGVRNSRAPHIGTDSTGATGNFAPVLTQEPGQTLRFAPVGLPFMAVLWFFKWTLHLYLLNLTKGAKFAGSVGHPMTKMLSALGGFAPLTRSSAPGSRWGLCPQTPIIGSCSALAMVPPQPLTPSAAYACE